MKRLLCIILFAFSAIPIVFASTPLKIAILELRPGVGVDYNRVDGLADMLTLELYQSGYFTIVERTQVQQVLDANNLTGKQLSREQQQSIGKKLEVDAVLIGTINYIIRDVKIASDGVTKVNVGEYNLDIRLVSTTDGSLLSSAGAQGGETERVLMNKVAVQLTQNLNTLLVEKKVHLLYNYLSVYPEDLGVFSSHPSMLIDITNRNASYGYTDWRLPTKEEMSLLEANTRLINLNRSIPYAYQGIWNNQSGNFNVRLVRSKVVTQQHSASTYSPYFENETYDFGIIPILGGSVQGKFCLQNPTKENIYIVDVVKTNSSISVSWDRNTISPGQYGFVYVTYNPNGRQGATLNNSLNVELSNGKILVINVRGRVK